MSLYKRNKTWWTDFRGVVQALPVGNLFSKLRSQSKLYNQLSKETSYGNLQRGRKT